MPKREKGCGGIPPKSAAWFSQRNRMADSLYLPFDGTFFFLTHDSTRSSRICIEIGWYILGRGCESLIFVHRRNSGLGLDETDDTKRTHPQKTIRELSLAFLIKSDWKMLKRSVLEGSAITSWFPVDLKSKISLYDSFYEEVFFLRIRFTVAVFQCMSYRILE